MSWATELAQQDPRPETINWLTLLNYLNVHSLILYLFICKYLLAPLAKQAFSELTEQKEKQTMKMWLQMGSETPLSTW